MRCIIVFCFDSMRCIIVNGSSIYFCHEYQHPAGPFKGYYGHQFVIVSGIPMAASLPHIQ